MKFITIIDGHCIRRDISIKLHGNECLPAFQGSELVIGIDATLSTRAAIGALRSDYSVVELDGHSMCVALPKEGFRIPETRSKSSTSQAQYVVEGQHRLPQAEWVTGFLVHWLNPLEHTSCHRHIKIGILPPADEYFIPLTKRKDPTARLYDRPDEWHHLNWEPNCVHGHSPHQLQAPPESGVATLIIMRPMPAVREMQGHQPVDSFVVQNANAT